MKTEFKPLKVEDFGLTPDELKIIVEGAQKFLPPADEHGEPISQEHTNASRPEHRAGRKPR
jgi:hypothetical protein